MQQQTFKTPTNLIVCFSTSIMYSKVEKVDTEKLNGHIVFEKKLGIDRELNMIKSSKKSLDDKKYWPLYTIFDSRIGVYFSLVIIM